MELKEYNPKGDSKEFCLVMDLGATNADTAIGSLDEKPKLIFKTNFKSKEISGVEEAINETLRIAKEKYDIEVSKACLAVPGPVNEERTHAKPANLDWEIDVKNVLKNTMLKEIIMLNDFEAITQGIHCLSKKDFDILQHGEERKDTVLVVGVGTGLGVSIAPYHIGVGVNVPIPSETSHTNLVIETSEEFEIAETIRKQKKLKHGLVYEEILSGRGIVQLYDALKEKHGRVEEIEKAEGENKNRLVMQNDKITCKKAVEMFIKIYARATKNLAMTSMARGGVYIAGGIANKNAELFKDGLFIQEFNSIDYPEYRELLEKLPVKLIKTYDVSLYGAIVAVQKRPELAQHL